MKQKVCLISMPGLSHPRRLSAPARLQRDEGSVEVQRSVDRVGTCRGGDQQGIPLAEVQGSDCLDPAIPLYNDYQLYTAASGVPVGSIRADANLG